MKRHKSISLLNKGILFLLLGAAGVMGCKKLVDVDDPITNPTSASVYTSDAKAASVLTSIYGLMSGRNIFAEGAFGVTVFAGLSADELETYPNITGIYPSLYTNSLNASQMGSGMWKELYNYIYIANAAIEGIQNSTGGMTDSIKRQLTGEAKFMRAFSNFYIVNLWGDAPLLTTTDYRANAIASRTSASLIYDQMVADLKDAQNLLSDNYLTPTGAITTERVRPNKGAATALLARVYLYQGKWAEAEAEATKVITNSTYKLVSDPDKAFLKASTEAIWQLQPVVTGYNSSDGNLFIRTVAPIQIEPVGLRAAFLTNFEAGDRRRAVWVDSITLSGTKYYFPSKYNVKGGPATTPVTEYHMVLRLAEQYLIRAEARAQQNKVTDAQTDLNAIRTRSLLGVTTAGDQASLLTAIAQERLIELFAEWGHRWFDLKRTGQVNAVMSVVTPLKGGAWNTNMQLYPIPAGEITLNPNLAPQNPGYN